MTKKDYVIIARVINSLAWNYQGMEKEQNCLILLVSQLSEMFKSQNSRFNSEKFNEACFKK